MIRQPLIRRLLFASEMLNITAKRSETKITTQMSRTNIESEANVLDLMKMILSVLANTSKIVAKHVEIAKTLKQVYVFDVLINPASDFCVLKKIASAKMLRTSPRKTYATMIPARDS